jgi:hypothetical protein
MKYRIEIWIYHHLHTQFESNNIKEVLKWYKEKWQVSYGIGNCTFYLFEDNKELSFDYIYKLGFYD